MKKALSWLLFLWVSAVILAALLAAPMSSGFSGLAGDSPQSSRIVYFHVPLAVASFIGFLAAGVWSALYLIRRQQRHDWASLAAVEVSLVFAVLATVTGAVWAKVQWGAYWNWDPRQTSIALALVFYGAYLTLRGAVEDGETRARLAAVYAVLGLVVAPFLYFVMPRMASFSLHPTPGTAEMASPILSVVLAGMAGFIALLFWMHSLRCRILALEQLDDV